MTGSLDRSNFELRFKGAQAEKVRKQIFNLPTIVHSFTSIHYVFRWILKWFSGINFNQYG